MIKVDKRVMAEYFEKSRRTVDSWVADGMQVMYVGGKPYYNVVECFKWKYKEDWQYYFKTRVFDCMEVIDD